MFKKIYLLILALFVSSAINVNAMKLSANKEQYTTSAGATISVEQYEKLLLKYRPELIDRFNQNVVDDIFANNIEVFKETVQYVVTKTYFDKNNNVVAVYNDVVPEDVAFDVAKNNGKGYMSPQELAKPVFSTNAVVSYQTDSKAIYGEYYYINGNKSSYYVSCRLFWLTQPKVKTFDVFAVRFSGNVNIINVTGEQNATSSSGSALQTKYILGQTPNIKTFSNGAGISMNLYDDGKDFYLNMTVQISQTSFNTAYASYQHAINSGVNLAISQSYTLASDGLGGVIKFNTSTISGYYDAMPGITMPTAYNYKQ